MRTLLLAALALGAAPAAQAQARKPAPVRKPDTPPAKKPATGGPDLPSQFHGSAPFCTVNGEEISLFLYLDRLSLAYAPQMRETLIAEALIRQEAARRKLTASTSEVDAVVERTYADTVRRVGGEPRLAEELKKTRGWTSADYKGVIRSQAPVQVLRDKLAAALVKTSDVTDAQIVQRYDAQKNRYAEPDTVRISHVVILRPADGNTAADQAARTKAEELFKKLQAAPDTFAQVARESSADVATAGRGGKLPIDIRRGDNPYGAAFEAAVFSAPLGLVPQVVVTPDSYRVVRVDERKEGRVKALAEVREEIRAELLNERRQQALDELLLRLRTSAKLQSGKF